MIMKELWRYRKGDTREKAELYCMFWYGYYFQGVEKKNSKALWILALWLQAIPKQQLNSPGNEFSLVTM